MTIIPGSLPAKHTLGSCGHRFVLPSHNTVTVVLESRQLPMGQCNARFNVQPKYIMCNFSHCILHCGGQCKAAGTEQEYSSSKAKVKHDQVWSANGQVTVRC